MNRPRAGPYDEPMTRHTTGRARPTGRALALLVLTVLAGVLGMHALAPDGGAGTHAPAHDAVATAHAPSGHRQVTHAPSGHQPSHAASDHRRPPSEPSVPEAGPGCSHTDGGPNHLDHADGNCAATGVGSSYAPPVPTAGLGVPPDFAAPDGTGRTAPAGRAPPDLAELQLLRI